MIAFIWSKPMITNYKEQFVQKKRTFFAYGKSMSVQKSTGTWGFNKFFFNQILEVSAFCLEKHKLFLKKYDLGHSL